MVYDYDFVNNGRVMAGYLGLASTKELRLLLASTPVQDTTNPWIAERKNGFKVLGRTAKYNWVIRQIWSTIEVIIQQHPNLLTQALPISNEDPQVDAKNDLTGYASWVVTAAKLLTNIPGVARDTQTSGLPMKGSFSCEDWFRAITLMKHAYRSQTETRAIGKNAKAKDSPSDMPRFLTNADSGGMALDDQDMTDTELRKRVDEILDDNDGLPDDIDELDDELAFEAFENYIRQVHTHQELGQLESIGRPALNKTTVMHVAMGLRARCRVRGS